MKGSLIIVAFFVAGVILARWDVLPQELLQQDFSMYVLYGLMFLVGISIGSDRKAWAALKGQQLRIVLVPLATIVGTLAGSIGVSFLLTDIRLTDCLAIGSGFGYYSLSSIFITEYRGAELGTIALTTNIIREIITLLGAAVLVRCFGKLAPICSGGATTMDTTLPVITRFSGKEYVIIAIFHGFVVDFSVPFPITSMASPRCCIPGILQSRSFRVVCLARIVFGTSAVIPSRFSLKGFVYAVISTPSSSGKQKVRHRILLQD